jgi:hypothetical protein
MSTLENALPKPKIELYSGKYFAACGLGGIIGEALPLYNTDSSTNLTVYSLWTYPYCSHTSRSRKDPQTSRQQALQIQLRRLG